MKTPILVLATPDGLPLRILDLWDRSLFSTIRVHERGFKTDSLEERIETLHEKILRDHQKTWFQLCRAGFKFDDTAYQESLQEILQTIHNESDRAVVDPLLCFFAPLWFQNMDQRTCLFYYSEPMEAAVSLQAKWRFPIHFGLALWEYYVIGALRQMNSVDYILFSSSRFREAPEPYLRETRRRFENLGGDPAANGRDLGILLKSEWNTSVALPDPARYLSQTQTDLFDRLESGDLDNTGALSLSDQSADILVQYGNLRAGYDQVKQEKEAMETELKLHQGVDTDKIAVTTAKSNRGSSASLVEVVVHIDGIDPLEFLVEQDNPVIETLNDALVNQSQAPNELVYLYCGESENAAIYFPAGDLLAVETNRLST